MRLKRLFLTIAAAAAFAASTAEAAPERRVALVIGNSAYVNAPPLANPRNDATEVGGALRRLGFQVIDGYDLNNTDMQRRVQEFAREVETADVALLFYAGHGLQVAGENYLVPVDAALKRQADLDFEAVKVDRIVKQMDVVSGPKILILDSCRDNPLATQLARSLGGKSRGLTGSGMSEMKTGVATGTLIAFATAPGSVAMDGDGRNSPFTTALLHHIETPGVDVDLMMKRVRGEVAGATRDQQQPWTNSSLNAEFYLKPVNGTPAAAGSAPAPVAVAALPNDRGSAQFEIESWKSAQALNTVEGYQQYLSSYPNGQFAGFARQMIDRSKSGAAVAPPMPPRLKDERNNEITESAIGLTGNDWTEIHQRLNLALNTPLAVKNKVDKKTRNALSIWQKNNGLNPSGFLSQDQYVWFKQATQALLNDLNAGRTTLVASAPAKQESATRTARSTSGEGSAPPKSRQGGNNGANEFFGSLARGVGEGVGRGLGCRMLGGGC